MGPHDHEVADDAQLATDPRNQAELQTLADMLRGLPPLTEPDDATDDSECQRIVELVERIGIRPQTAPDSGAALLAPNSHRLGQYKLLAKLGQGGMGAVYKALHTKLDKLVALKVLPADRLQDAAAVARFEREMRAVGKLAHENIVAAMDAGEIDGTHYLVMELVAGVDLGNIARERAPLPVAEACEIIRQAALGLQHAHIHNLVHRDIKPSNLMLAQGSCGPLVKILDMDLALLDEQHSEHADLTASGQIMGTLDYMAPEQAGDTHTVDIRADIYSLGATLYKLLTGRVPFQGPQYTSTVKKLMALSTQDPPRIDSFREDLPPELVDVVHRMLARQPEDRYATPGEVAAAMAAFAAGANLAAFLEGTNAPQGDADQTALLQTVTKGAASVSVRSSVVETQSQVLPGPSRRTGLQPAAAPDNRPPRRSKRGVLLAGAAVPIVVLLGVILLSLRTPHGEIVVELADDIPAEAAKNLKIEVIGNGQVKVADASAGWTIDIAEGKYQAKLSGGADQFQLEQNQVTVTRGEKALLKVSLKPLGETPTRELHAGTGPAPDPSTVAPKTWQPTPEQRAFFDHVATLPADEQAAAVAQKLMEVNPGFDGTTEHKVEGGQVTYFRCRSEHLTDIWPIRALAQLKDLDCGGTNSGAAKISDLSPLRGMALTSLTCWRSPVVDISPLSDMPLTVLDLRSTTVTDLSPLRGVQLTRLFFDGTHVNDLSPLSGMPLERINFNGTSVDDLAPLRGMRLTRLQCGYTNITDLSALQGMPLEQLACSGTRVADLSPLTGMPLTHLEFAETKVRDLSPLRGMPLTRLNCGHTSIADISSLQGMKLTEINLYKTPVSDLSVLTGMPLQKLFYDVRLFDEGDRVLIQSLPLTHLNGPSPDGTPILITQKELDARREAALAFADATSHMSPAEQVKAVVAKLAELNEPNVATLHVRHASNGITDIILTLEDSIHRKPFDITPLMGFTKLKTLEIIGGMPYLDISFTKHFLACSPKAGPAAMRVLWPHLARRTFHEAEAAHT